MWYFLNKHQQQARERTFCVLITEYMSDTYALHWWCEIGKSCLLHTNTTTCINEANIFLSWRRYLTLSFKIVAACCGPTLKSSDELPLHLCQLHPPNVLHTYASVITFKLGITNTTKSNVCFHFKSNKLGFSNEIFLIQFQSISLTYVEPTPTHNLYNWQNRPSITKFNRLYSQNVKNKWSSQKVQNWLYFHRNTNSIKCIRKISKCKLTQKGSFWKTHMEQLSKQMHAHLHDPSTAPNNNVCTCQIMHLHVHSLPHQWLLSVCSFHLTSWQHKACWVEASSLHVTFDVD